MAKNKGTSSVKTVAIECSSDDEDQNLTYEQVREKNIKKNLGILETLGINNVADKLVNSINKKQSGVKRKCNFSNTLTPSPFRRSQRIANLLTSATPKNLNKLDLLLNEEKNNEKNNENIPENNLNNQISLSAPEDLTFFEKLNADISIEKKAVNCNVHTYNIDKYITLLKGLKMLEPPLKVITSRIYSLAIHPSEKSLIIAAGDMKGNISLYNKDNSIKSKNIYCVHKAPINCVSFCSWDPYKLFSTSHDGSVRCGDIVNRTFDMIFNTNLWDNNTANSQNLTLTHTTWHTEYERNLLISSGAGRVDLVDTRIPNKIQNTVWCHERSVRTVQCHPSQNHYFLTSSAIGEVALWDLRHITNKGFNPVLKFENSGVLKSAFFSATGINMISTSNDDIKIYNTSQLNATATTPVTNIPHNNITGRWLSVIKAKWIPGRDDIFFTGSMIASPKRIEMYKSDGTLLHKLTDESHVTYCPVIEAHPTQAFYVGGNASGRIHIYSNPA